jgi:MinD-like ATPase involved in chromosome partitioning or flagellar assembly
MQRVIGIISGKGGVGKTTVALNLAASLARHYNIRTALVDCNVTTSHIGLHFGTYNYPKTLNHVLKGEASIHDASYDVMSNMNLVPASISLRDLEGIDIINLKDSIRQLSERHDVVLLDSAPGLGREAMGTLRSCDEVIMVGNPNLLSVTDLLRCQEVCQELGVAPIGIAMNMVHKDKYEIDRQEIERLCGLPVLASVPYHRNVRRSTSMPQPIVIQNPKDKASREFIRLSSHVARMPYPYQKRRFRLF